MFGELRSILHHPHSHHAWDALCDTLDRWHDPCSLAEEAIPYALDQLQHWRELPCAAPAHWLRRPDDPRLALASQVWLSADGLHSADAVRALHEANMPRLRAVRSTRTPLDLALIEALAKAPWIQAVHTIQLDHALLSHDAILCLADAPLSALHTLRLAHNALTDRSARSIAHMNAPLRRLALPHNALTVACLPDLMARSDLEHLDLSHNEALPATLRRLLPSHGLPDLLLA